MMGQCGWNPAQRFGEEEPLLAVAGGDLKVEGRYVTCGYNMMEKMNLAFKEKILV